MKAYAFDGDRVVMDLVAHFLGIATHHNINAAPSSWPVIAVIPRVRGSHGSSSGHARCR